MYETGSGGSNSFDQLAEPVQSSGHPSPSVVCSCGCGKVILGAALVVGLEQQGRRTDDRQADPLGAYRRPATIQVLEKFINQ